MATQAEEQQAQEFLKRAEIRTMRKDLLRLREADSIKERNKIATIKTLEEQQLQQKKKMEEAERARAGVEKAGREEVLLANENQEYNAEKDLKTYATEQERQQIFLFESQRFNLATQIKDIDEKKDPALKMEKNKTLLEIGNWQTRLNSIVEQEKKLEDEQKLIAQKEQTSAIPSERKSLSERKWDLDKGIQDIEKKRWEVEKQIQDYEAKIKIFDQSSGQLVVEKNNLRDKMLGIDKSLREIYSGVIARIEERRRGEAADQKARRELLEKAQAEKNEQIQRAQYSGRAQAQQKGILSKVPEALKDKLAKTESAEEEQRKKFLQEVDQGTNKNIGQQQQKSNT